jgi:hypothetical protein
MKVAVCFQLHKKAVENHQRLAPVIRPYRMTASVSKTLASHGRKRLMTRAPRSIALSLLLSGLLLASTAASAHHSFAMFDATKSITVTGTVKNVSYANPHVWVDMVVMNGKGDLETWGMEGGNLGGLYRMGWTKDTVKVGDKITMEVHPIKNGMTGGQIMRVTLADGRVLGRGPARQDQ